MLVCNILASITVASFTVNGFGVIRDPMCRSGRVVCGRLNSTGLVVRPWCYPVAQVPCGSEKN